MKILELGKFYPPHHGGIETLLRSWCEGFARLGAEVDCVVANDARQNAREEINGVHVHRLASYGTLASTSICPGYLDSTRRFPADVWHVHFPNPLADLACLRGDPQTPLVLSYHSDVVRQAGWMSLYRPLLQHLLRRATRIVVATPNHLEYSPWLGAYREKCDVIPFGIDLARFAPTPDLMQAAAELRQTVGGKSILLNIGRLVGYKGQCYLLEAARELDAVVWLVGVGPLEAELRQQAQALGLGGRVRFWGAVDVRQLAALLHACTVFVLPSVTPNEAFGIAQVEAMACGKPVVSCALRSGVPFVNQDGVTGLIIPPADAPALATALRRLLQEPAWGARLGEAGRRRAGQEFEESVMVERYWQCFQRLSARSGQP